MSSVIYASATRLNAIIATDMNGGQMTIVASTLRAPRGIAFGPDNALYVVEAAAGRLSILDPSGTSRQHAAGLGDPGGVAIDNNGLLYVTDWRSNSIKVVDTKGTVRTLATGTAGASLIAFDGTRYLYVSGGSNHTLSRFDLDGKGGPFQTMLGAATGLACDRNGNLYVSGERWVASDGSRPCIAKFAGAGNREVLINGAPFTNLLVLGYTLNGYMLYTEVGTTLTMWRTRDVFIQRSSAWAAFAAARGDFSYAPI